MSEKPESSARNVGENFITRIIDADLASGKHSSIVTRFPPEPNGYLHIGHAKSICLNFGIAEDYSGRCHLRFDDTNPAKESVEYAESIKRDVKWLGFDWGEHLYHASDYFETLYKYAEELIEKGLAYVDDQSPEEIRANRGTLTEPGVNSPYRERPVDENLDLFRRMRAGEFADGSRVLRAKIDMASPNINLRDPVIYRIKRQHHIRTGDAWVIYPMYDFTHCISDTLEGITHSLCTLEFEDHRPLYDWFLDNITIDCHPQQIEFARLELQYTVTSKRKLNQLVEQGLVDGWDDPRMPTLSGMRRRGYPPAAIRELARVTHVTKNKTTIPLSVLEGCVRDELNRTAPRAMAVLDPLKVVIENYPEGKEEWLTAKNHPQDESFGTRKIPFSREIYVERSDFMENAPRKFFRLAPGREVRLRYAYYVTCTDVIKDDNGQVVELRCTYDPETRGGSSPDGRKVKGTIHWVSAPHAKTAEIRLYDRLFKTRNPAASEDFTQHLNPDSLKILHDCKLEPSILEAPEDTRFQFERMGYFVRDTRHETSMPVFNRIESLRDSWSKIEQAENPAG